MPTGMPFSFAEFLVSDETEHLNIYHFHQQTICKKSTALKDKAVGKSTYKQIKNHMEKILSRIKTSNDIESIPY